MLEKLLNKALSNTTALRSVTVMMSLLFVAFFIARFFPAHAEQDTFPYKAITVDECIQEKECVWYHLLLAVQAEPMKQEITGNLNVRKWEEPIRFKVKATTNGINGERIDGWYKSVARFTTQKISVEEVENFLILLTDDIEAELEGPYRKIFQGVFGDDRILDHYRAGPKKRGDKCHYVLLQDPRLNNAVYSYFSFIQKDHPDIQSCIKEAIYVGLGLSSIANSLIFENYQTDGPYTKLELLLILLVYQDRIRSGMSFDELKLTFHEIYDPLIQLTKEKGIFNAY